MKTGLDSVYRLIVKNMEGESDVRFQVTNLTVPAMDKPYLCPMSINMSKLDYIAGRIPKKDVNYAFANIEYRNVGKDNGLHLYNKLISKLVERDIPVFVYTDIKEELEFGEGVVVYRWGDSVNEQMLELIVKAADPKEIERKRREWVDHVEDFNRAITRISPEELIRPYTI